MKKILLVISVISMLFFSGCDFLNGTTTTTVTTTGENITNIETSIQTNNTTTEEITTMVTTFEQTQTTVSDTTTIRTTEELFEVAFNSMGGSNIDVQFVESGSTINLPVPIREGYTFSGWFTGEGVNDTQFTESSVVLEVFTLFARWDINQYTINFELNGGSAVDSITQDYDVNIFQPDNPNKDGYTFDGWFSDSEFTFLYTFTTMSSENITLYAKWVAVDWGDIELYLSNLLADELSGNISLPTTYLAYSISWESSDPEILSDDGVYYRPYQATVVTLSAIIQLGQLTATKTYDVDIEGYKSLSAPLTSSYIYRDYSSVSDSFFTALDIINCAFITANSDGTLHGSVVLANISTYIMPKAQEQGNWVLFSIAPDSSWSEIVLSSSRINTFADNIVAMINEYGFDGVDIDWETPTSSEATLFTEMMRVIYTKVKANNPNHLVTAAIAGGMWQPPRYDLENSHQYIDYINMMTYGMVSNNGYYQNALKRSTTYANPTNVAGKTLTSCSIEESIEIYNSYGIPNSRIIVGVAFYGIKQIRSYDSVSQTWSDWVKEGSVSYSYISSYYLNNSSYNYYYDTNAGVPYIMKTDGTLFISYDNPRSIMEKSEYIIEHGLAGMMYWENGLDSTGALLLAMEEGLKD